MSSLSAAGSAVHIPAPVRATAVVPLAAQSNRTNVLPPSLSLSSPLHQLAAILGFSIDALLHEYSQHAQPAALHNSSTTLANEVGVMEDVAATIEPDDNADSETTATTAAHHHPALPPTLTHIVNAPPIPPLLAAVPDDFMPDPNVNLDPMLDDNEVDPDDDDDAADDDDDDDDPQDDADDDANQPLDANIQAQIQQQQGIGPGEDGQMADNPILADARRWQRSCHESRLQQRLTVEQWLQFVRQMIGANTDLSVQASAENSNLPTASSSSSFSSSSSSSSSSASSSSSLAEAASSLPADAGAEVTTEHRRRHAAAVLLSKYCKPRSIVPSDRRCCQICLHAWNHKFPLLASNSSLPSVTEIDVDSSGHVLLPAPSLGSDLLHLRDPSVADIMLPDFCFLFVDDKRSTSDPVAPSVSNDQPALSDIKAVVRGPYFYCLRI